MRKPQQEKIQGMEELKKRNSDSPRMKVRRYSVLMRLKCTARFTERSDFRCTISTLLLELGYYSSFGALLLLLFWTFVITPLLELCYYSSLIRVRLEHLCYTFSRALLLNPIGAN